MATVATQRAVERLDETRASVRLEISVTLIAAIATLLMLEATRVFLGYTVFVIDQERRGLIAATAFGVFAAFILGGLVCVVLRPKGAVATTVFLLLTARTILQFTEHPETRLILGGVAVVAW